MIINVRGCTNRSGIIVSYLVVNKEETGYSSFDAKKFTIKNKTDILAAIKKTLILTRKIPVIKADAFVSTIGNVSKKNVCDTSAKQIVRAVNEENMQSRMLSLSYIRFNGKPLPQVKAINIVNGNMYFMIKRGSDYILELIENKKIECMITISSLVNLYRIIKQKTDIKRSPKYFFKSAHTARAAANRVNTEGIRNTWQSNPYRTVYAARGLPESTDSPVETRESAEETPAANSNDWLASPVIYDFNSEEIADVVIPTITPIEEIGRPVVVDYVFDEANVEQSLGRGVPERPVPERPEGRQPLEGSPTGRRAAEVLIEEPTVRRSDMDILQTVEIRAEESARVSGQNRDDDSNEPEEEEAQAEEPLEREQPNLAEVSDQDRDDGSDEPEEEPETPPDIITPRSAFIEYLREQQLHGSSSDCATYTITGSN